MKLRYSADDLKYLPIVELKNIALVAQKDARTEHSLARRWMDERTYRVHAWARQDHAAIFAGLARAALFEIIDRQNGRGRRERW